MLPADSPFARLPAPGPHPAPAELRAYATGTLAPAEQHRLEAHALDCERCADVLAGLAMSPPAATDQAVAALRTRLQARLAAENPAPATRPWARPRVAAAVAALGLAAAGLWTWEQRTSLPPPATARLETAAPAAPVPQSEPALAAPPAAETPAAADAAYAVGPAVRRPSAPATQLLPGALRRNASVATAAASKASNDGALRPATVAEAPAATPRMAESARLADAAGLAAAPAAPAASAPDSTARTAETRMAGAYARAKAAPAAAAPVRGSAAPMPAAPGLAPAPVGGTAALRSYLHRQTAAFEPGPDERRLSGTVRVRFVVEANGQLGQLTVTRGLSPAYDAEALRMLCEGPAWQPGIVGGRRGPLTVEVTVPF